MKQVSMNIKDFLMKNWSKKEQKFYSKPSNL